MTCDCWPIAGQHVETSSGIPGVWTASHGFVCLQDNRLAWYDLDLSTRPYRALRYHHQALRGVAFHRSYPLFASASDDGTVHVFHGMVYQVRASDCTFCLTS